MTKEKNRKYTKVGEKIKTKAIENKRKVERNLRIEIS